MPDPIVQSEIIRNLMDAYRVFSQEMRLIGQKKADLIRSIIARVDAERLAEISSKIKDRSYERDV